MGGDETEEKEEGKDESRRMRRGRVGERVAG